MQVKLFFAKPRQIFTNFETIMEHKKATEMN